MAPSLTPSAEGILLSWIEPRAEGGHRLRLARFSAGAWGPPATVVEGDRFFANWADFPSVVEGDDGRLLAHWLEKNGEGTYAYGVQLAASRDGGESWRGLGTLHDDESPSEHGFVSLIPRPEGVQAFWLDGRATLEGGAMQLRTTLVTDRPGPSTLLDESVCDCCQTAAIDLEAGPLVAYRDRLEGEVRDISLRRRGQEGEWSPPLAVHRDGWVFAACPVNGPALAADGRTIAAAWFTAEGDDPRVLAAFSTDGGATFGPPVEVDDRDAQGTLGRVDVETDGEGGALVSWLAAEEGKGTIYLRRVAPDGGLGDPVRLASTAASRGSGFPRILRLGDELFAVWVEVREKEGAPSRLVFRSLAVGEIPPAT